MRLLNQKQHTMKNLKLIAIILFSTVLITSCKDDEASQNADIVGVWNVTNLSIDFTVNNTSLTDFFGTEANAAFYETFFSAIFEDAFDGATIEFIADGTYKSPSPGETAETGTWTLDGDTLTFGVSSAESISFTVINSTNSALTLQYKELDDSTDYDQDGVNDEFETILDLNLTK